MTTTLSDPSEHLPLGAVEFLVLLILADGDSHGYAMVKEIERRSSGHIRMLPGNFYRVLRRLVDDGLIEAVERAPAEEGSDQRRRYFAVTPFGRDVAAAEAARMREMVAAAEARDLVAELPR